MNKALFLDRDGIINIDHGYVHKIDDFEFIDGIFELCQLAMKNDYKIFIITNQAGIARGYYDIATFETLTQWMVKEFSTKDIVISKVYFCPHHPSKGINNFVKACECRKPEPGMILKAKTEFNLDLQESIFIGDKTSDMWAAKNAGVFGKILVESRYIKDDLDPELNDVIRIDKLIEAYAHIK